MFIILLHLLILVEVLADAHTAVVILSITFRGVLVIQRVKSGVLLVDVIVLQTAWLYSVSLLWIELLGVHGEGLCEEGALSQVRLFEVGAQEVVKEVLVYETWSFFRHLEIKESKFVCLLAKLLSLQLH